MKKYMKFPYIPHQNSRNSMTTVFYFINKWTVLSFPDEIFLNAIYKVTLIALLSPFIGGLKSVKLSI